MIAKTFPFPKTFPAQERKTLRPVKSLRDHARWYRPGEGRVTYYWPNVDPLSAGQERDALRAELGRQVARLHTITGTGFGYPSAALGPLRDS